MIDPETPLLVQPPPQPDVHLRLEGAKRPYYARDTLRGNWRIDDWRESGCQAAELSVIWRTSGKGEEDIGVYYFARFTPDDLPQDQLGEAHPFEVTLPECPLSYNGVIIKVGWCVRLRLFLTGGREVVVDRAFRLGNAAELTAPTAPEVEAPNVT